jgi:hypothetical protein
MQLPKSRFLIFSLGMESTKTLFTSVDILMVKQQVRLSLSLPMKAKLTKLETISTRNISAKDMLNSFQSDSRITLASLQLQNNPPEEEDKVDSEETLEDKDKEVAMVASSSKPNLMVGKETNNLAQTCIFPIT